VGGGQPDERGGGLEKEMRLAGTPILSGSTN